MVGKGKPRRPKGTGSMYERGGVVIGQYEVQMPEGKIKRKYARGKDKKEVASKLAKAIADRDSGVVYDSDAARFGQHPVPTFLHLERTGLQWPLHDFAAVAVVNYRERSNPARWHISRLGIYIHLLRKALIHNVMHNLWITIAGATPNVVCPQFQGSHNGNIWS